jgi:membrane fusion protein
MTKTENSRLFRNEVYSELEAKSIGEIRLNQPISIAVISALSFIAFTSLILYSLFGTITKKSRAVGVILPAQGTVAIQSSTAGIIAKIFVQQGSRVTTGESLIEVNTEHYTPGGDLSDLVYKHLKERESSLQRELSARIEQLNIKRVSFTARRRSFDNESIQLEKEITLAKKREFLAHQTVEQYQMLENNHYISKSSYQQKQDELVEVSGRLSSLQRSQIQLNTSKLNLDVEETEFISNLNAEKAQIQRSIASVSQEMVENSGRKSLIIRATQPGIISTIVGQTGQLLAAGQTVAVLVAEGECNSTGHPITQCGSRPYKLEANLFATSKVLGVVEPGQKVNMRYQSFPYQKFGLQSGEITEISDTPLSPSDLPATFASTILNIIQSSGQGQTTPEAVYRIKVRLDRQNVYANGKSYPLRLGTAIDANIEQTPQYIWEWLLEPILAVAKR